MIENINGAMIEVGDWIIDRMDDDRMRKVIDIREEGDDNEYSVYMEDGGVMSANEIKRDDIRLVGEVNGYN